MEYIFNDKILKFTEAVCQTFDSYRQIKIDQPEAGGILLGRVYTDEIVVEQITVPNNVDKSGRYFFDRNVKRAQQTVDIAWKESNGEVIYLGEWHTHPEAAPSPSMVDRRLIKNMLRDTKMSLNFLFMVIVGTESKYVAVQFTGKNKKIIRLQKRN